MQAGFEEQIASLNTRISALNDKNTDLQNELQSKLEALNSSAHASEEAKAGVEHLLQNEITSNTDKDVQIKQLQDKVNALGKEAPAYKEQLDLLDKAREEAESKVASLIKSKEDLATEFNKQLSILKDEKRETEIKLQKELRSLESDKIETEGQLKSRVTELEKESEIKRMNTEEPKTPPVITAGNPVPEVLEPVSAKPEEVAVKKPKIESKQAKEENTPGKVVSGSVIEKDSVNKEILVDLAKADGVVVGQTMAVMRENDKIAELKVVKVSDNFTVAKTLLEKDFNAIELFDKAELSL